MARSNATSPPTDGRRRPRSRPSAGESAARGSAFCAAVADESLGNITTPSLGGDLFGKDFVLEPPSLEHNRKKMRLPFRRCFLPKACTVDGDEDRGGNYVAGKLRTYMEMPVLNPFWLQQLKVTGTFFASAFQYFPVCRRPNVDIRMKQ